MFLKRFAAQNQLKVLSIISLCLIFYNEFAVYFINYMNWPALVKTNDQTVRLLLVADPQLIGENDEFYGWLARWDSDRYLKSTFLLANNYVKPDATLFLGDLFDEGLKASDQQYKRYFDRFNAIFQCEKQSKLNGVTQLFIPGDNDIGGEYFNDRNALLARRFETFFGGDLVDVDKIKSFIDIIKLDLDYTSSYYDKIKREKLRNKLSRSNTFSSASASSAASVSESSEPQKTAPIQITSPNVFTVILNHVSIVERNKDELNMVYCLLYIYLIACEVQG